jgi:serine/threonine protein kinase
VENREFIDKVNTLYRDIIIPIWTSLGHVHICPFIAINCAKGTVPSIQVPFYKQGNVLEYNSRYPDVDKMQQITEMADGLNYLHGKGIRHANFCPANVLIDNGRVRITDPCLNFLLRQIVDDGYISTPASYQYSAPEDLLGTTEVDAKADVYSWACVVYEVFSGQRPYRDQHYGQSIFKITTRGHRSLARPSKINKHLWMLLLKCWAEKSEDRPSMHEVLLELGELSVVRPSCGQTSSLQDNQTNAVLCAA